MSHVWSDHFQNDREAGTLSDDSGTDIWTVRLRSNGNDTWHTVSADTRDDAETKARTMLGILNATTVGIRVH